LPQDINTCEVFRVWQPYEPALRLRGLYYITSELCRLQTGKLTKLYASILHNSIGYTGEYPLDEKKHFNRYSIDWSKLLGFMQHAQVVNRCD